MWLVCILGLAGASLLILFVPGVQTWFYARADAWLDEQRGNEVLATRIRLAQTAERARRDPRGAAAISSALAARLERRGGCWTPLQARALETTVSACRAAKDTAGELAARRKLLTLQPGRVRRRAELGECLLRAGHAEEGLRLLRTAFERDPNCLEALVPLVERALAHDQREQAQRLVRRYERALLLPQSLVAASRKSAIRLLGSENRPVASWRCAPPIDGTPHLLRLSLAGRPTRGQVTAFTLTITVGPACGALVLHHLRFLETGGGELLRLSGGDWPTMEVIGGNRDGADRIVIARERIRVGFQLPRPVALAELDTVELRLTLEKRFPPPLDALRSKR